MMRDFYSHKIFEINIHTEGPVQDFHVEHHYHQIEFQRTQSCCTPLALANVIKFTKHVGKKCMDNSYAMANGALTWIKVAMKKPKFKRELERNNKDKVTLQLLRDEIQEIKQLVKELQKYKCPRIGQETGGIPPRPPPPPPPPLPVQVVTKILPRPSVRRENANVADQPSRPTISLEDLLKVKLKKPSERKCQLARRKTCESLQQVNLRPTKKVVSEPESFSNTDVPQSPISSLKRLLTNINEQKSKRRRK